MQIIVHLVSCAAFFFTNLCVLVVVSLIILAWNPLVRCGLPCVPSLKGRENVQFISLQHNLICRIDSLTSFQMLKVLNLYDNKIERISGLDTLTSLRVLMLGKNRYRIIRPSRWRIAFLLSRLYILPLLCHLIRFSFGFIHALLMVCRTHRQSGVADELQVGGSENWNTERKEGIRFLFKFLFTLWLFSW